MPLAVLWRLRFVLIRHTAAATYLSATIRERLVLRHSTTPVHSRTFLNANGVDSGCPQFSINLRLFRR